MMLFLLRCKKHATDQYHTCCRVLNPSSLVSSLWLVSSIFILRLITWPLGTSPNCP
jgi:hypothetical protein